ncbi:MAG: hypothetical protein LBH00_11450 [Planctomycetaceae bacterium]|jgi:hypothetical protein|nr:hypothetical protein [Planctomycetaceae bacterium]
MRILVLRLIVFLLMVPAGGGEEIAVCRDVFREILESGLELDETGRQRLFNGNIPPEEHIDSLCQWTERLARTVPKSFLQKNGTSLKGTAVFVTKFGTVYRVKLILPDHRETGYREAVIFTPVIPNGWSVGQPMRESTAAAGVYLKTYQNVPIFAAPAMQWFPNTWLGRIGFDAAAFDRVPVYRVTERDQHDAESNRRAFKLTEFDSEPFYGLLRAVSAMPAGRLEQEAKRQQAESPVSVTELFNNPRETRGKAVLLHGTAKRIIRTAVTDDEVQWLFGIDFYYQIYLFTAESQGNPIVVCVRSLPDGLQPGDSPDFAEQITVAAVPYKLWIFETKKQPHYAPLLIGREPVWHPKPVMPKPPSSAAAVSLTLFLTLWLIWFACRQTALLNHRR